jgi:hypothetical protein
MQGRIKGLIAFLILLALAGWLLALRECNKPTNVTLDVQQLSGSMPEVDTAGLAENSIVTWVSTVGQFYVEFEDPNPCIPSTGPDGSDIYIAAQSNGTGPYKAQCTIKNAPAPNPSPSYYHIHPGIPPTPPPPPPPPPPPVRDGHCSGCAVDN